MRMKFLAATAVVTLATGGLVANGLGASASSGSAPHGWPVAASSGPDTSEITTGRTIKLVAHQDHFQFINTGGKGFTPGDYFVFEETLRNRDSGQVVGRDSVKCTANFRTVMCQGTFLFSGKGNVEFSGATTEHGKVLLSVTGGTERFQNARGQLHVGSESGKNINLTLYLLP